MFQVEDLRYSIGSLDILGPVSLAIPAGRLTALLGHNGSGKSTLLKLLARQDKPSAGRIRMNGEDLAQSSDRAFARRVAYLPQHPPITEGLRVRELVAMGRYPWRGLLGRLTARDQERIDQALAETVIEDFAERMVDSLSGGERQRVWLAMLLAQDTETLLLDEPTSALDVAHQVEVLELVRRLCHERRLTVLVVMHDVNMAARFCDYLIALRHGHLCAEGEPAQLMNDSALGAIYGIPMGVFADPEGRQISYVK